MTVNEMERSFVRRQNTKLSYPVFLVVAVCCLSLYVPEIISFTVLFAVMIVEGNCQLVHGMERDRFALFPVCYQVLEAIWQPLIETIAED